MANTAHGKIPRLCRPAARGEPTPTITPQSVPGAMSARIVSITEDGVVLVAVADQTPIAALVSQQVPPDQLRHAQATASPVLVVLLDDDLQRPVIIGVLVSTIARSSHSSTATVDGRRVELTGHDEVVLTCGKASITLTKAGKVLIKGTYVSSSASQGINRITGGSIQIN